MKICDYGCGQEAKYKLQNGKWCCSESYKKCKEIIRKNKEGQQKVKTYKECPYCHKMISYGIGNQYQLHINSCTYDKNKTIFKAIDNVDEDIARWQKWYNSIIEKRIKEPLLHGYKEKHHILPKSLGGSNNKDNLIYLTAKEHYICHLLLVRIYQKNPIAYKKMLYALFRLGNCNKHYNSNTYKIYREEYINTCCVGHHNQDGEKNSAFGKKWMSNNKLKISKMIKLEMVDLYLKDGWEFGNKNWLKIERTNKNKKIKQIKTIKKEKTKEKDIELYNNYYKIYNEHGWNEFVIITKYPYSKANFVNRCKKLLKDFIPQNGKKRGKKSTIPLCDC